MISCIGAPVGDEKTQKNADGHRRRIGSGAEVAQGEEKTIAQGQHQAGEDQRQTSDQSFGKDKKEHREASRVAQSSEI